MSDVFIVAGKKSNQVGSKSGEQILAVTIFLFYFLNLGWFIPN